VLNFSANRCALGKNSQNFNNYGMSKKTKKILSNTVIIFMSLMLVFAFAPFLFTSPSSQNSNIQRGATLQQEEIFPPAEQSLPQNVDFSTSSATSSDALEIKWDVK